MLGDKPEVQMVQTTYNEAMGGRLREGHVYAMAPEYAYHLLAQGLAVPPTAKGRTKTEMTQDEEVSMLRARLAALTGDAEGSAAVGRASEKLLGGPPVIGPMDSEGAQPLIVMPKGKAKPNSVGTPEGETIDLLGNESKPEDK